MTEDDLHALLSGLSQHRPVFHSEADLQHALAWEIQKRFPKAKIRLEYRVPHKTEKIYLDILVVLGGVRIGIELKYKTEKCESFVHGEERYEFLDQGARPLARYDFVKDIHRLETNPKGIDKGFAVFLTNDRHYWESGRGNTMDIEFRIHDQAKLKMRLKWDTEKGEKTLTSKRRSVVRLARTYSLSWSDYSTEPKLLRYLLVSIPQKSKG